MPELETGHHLVDYFEELGRVETGMSAAPFRWSEINHWSQLTGIHLSPWEVLTLHAMSEAYCISLQESSGKQVPSPWSFQQAEPENIEKALDTAFDFVNLALSNRRASRGSRHN